MVNQPNKLSCSVCKKEIPKSAKKTSEGADYISHFCSASCRDKWPKLSSEIVASPERFYNAPSEVLKDTRLNNQLKLKVLESWEDSAVQLQKADEENMNANGRSRLSEIHQAILALKESS